MINLVRRVNFVKSRTDKVISFYDEHELVNYWIHSLFLWKFNGKYKSSSFRCLIDYHLGVSLLHLLYVLSSSAFHLHDSG